MPGNKLLSEQFVGALTPSESGGKAVLHLDDLSALAKAQSVSDCRPSKLSRANVEDPDLIPQTTSQFAVEWIDT